MSQKVCPNCRNLIPDTAAFCSRCGMSFSMVPTQPAPYGGYTQQPVYAVKPKVPGRGFGISSMVLGIVGLFYSFYMTLAVPAMADMGSYVTENSRELFGSYYQYAGMMDEMLLTSLLIAMLMIGVMPLLGVIFGFSAKKRGYNNGVSKSGIITGGIGLGFLAIGIFLVLSYM